MPKFDDRQVFLKTLGGYVVDEIRAKINLEQQPDGSPQKQNSKAYAERKFLKKGYTTPLKGMASESPYLSKRTTFLRDYHAPDTLLIHLNPRREAIGIKLTDMGYWFMGITREAEARIRKAADQYFKGKMRQMAGKKYG